MFVAKKNRRTKKKGFRNESVCCKKKTGEQNKRVIGIRVFVARLASKLPSHDRGESVFFKVGLSWRVSVEAGVCSQRSWFCLFDRRVCVVSDGERVEQGGWDGFLSVDEVRSASSIVYCASNP